MNITSVSKAVAGAAGAAATSLATVYVSVPPDIVMPWYAYPAIGLLNAAIGFAFVYFAPRNQ
jgi:phosphate/sulfate permease